MSMSKKDYELVAGVIKDVKDTLRRVPAGMRGAAYETPEATVDVVAGQLAAAFRKENPNFKMDRFIEATR